MLAEQHTSNMIFFHKFSFTINGMETLYFNNFCKTISCWKMLTYSLWIQLCLFSISCALPKSDSTIQKEHQIFRTVSWSYSSFTKIKSPEGKKKIVRNVALTAARNKEAGRTPYYLKQQHILLVQFTIEHK